MALPAGSSAGLSTRPTTRPEAGTRPAGAGPDRDRAGRGVPLHRERRPIGCAVNRIGHEKIVGDGLEFFGHSFICDPFGRMLTVASHDKEEILTAKVDPACCEETRRNWPFLRDRRVDAYGDITKRFSS